MFLINILALFGQEYTILVTGEDGMREKNYSGSIRIRKETDGRIIIVPTMTTNYKYGIIINNLLCPIIPENESFSITEYTKEIVIDRNTTTITYSNDSWEKTIVNGNTSTTTYSNGTQRNIIVAGNVTTITYSNGSWSRTVTEGNTTMMTNSYNKWTRTVIDGNIITITESDGSWRQIVVDGNSETAISSMAPELLIRRIIDGNIETITTTSGSYISIERKVIDENFITVTRNGEVMLNIERQGYNIYLQLKTANSYMPRLYLNNHDRWDSYFFM
jgi:hypothetical protein